MILKYDVFVKWRVEDGCNESFPWKLNKRTTDLTMHH